MSTVVVDTSTLLKWVLPESEEEYIDQANAIAQSALAGRLSLLLPSLWYYEAGNILARKIPEQAGAAMAHLVTLLMPWTQQPTPDTLALALELIRRHGVTFYDASYHALAIASGGVLVTADARYVRKVGASENLVSLADWPLV
jgi:predicted nucleic acid-binding protein